MVPIPIYVYTDYENFMDQIDKDFLPKAIEAQASNKAGVEFIFGSDHIRNSTLVIARNLIDYLNSNKVRIAASGHGEALNYAKRLNFFDDFSGATYSFEKRNPGGRFLELEKIDSHDTKVSGKVERALYDYCALDGVFISEEAYDIITYSIGELISNVRRHSGSRGRVSFQYYKKSGINTITVSDVGVGIPSTLRKGLYEGEIDELLKMSIQKEVTCSRISTSYESRSPGVGLYNICRLAESNSNCLVTIVSNGYKMTINEFNPIESPQITKLKGFFPGTQVMIHINNNIDVSLDQILERATPKLSLL
ncbi:ATP-binding protein [Paenibacillus sp. SN-8-1]|uniref:ATP-binding protein n=1 Tax=Paenibacillus sp. SN-8-1 TaxID=3435409 RepID=UPI003D9A2B35